MKLMEWTLDFIHKNNNFGWVEGRRVEWVLPLQERIAMLLEGKAFVLSSDKEREWFVKYFLHNINDKANLRPLLPFFSLKSLFDGFEELQTPEEFSLLEDMLKIAFPQGFIYFFIGKAGAKNAQFVRGKENGYLWLFDQQDANSFLLSSRDELLDAKLLQLFELFNRSISGVLHGKITIN